MNMREMKDSGIDIVKDIPFDWSVIRLKYLCDIQTGNQDTQDADDEGEFNFYVRSPIVERSTRYTFDGEGILMAGDGAGAGRIFHHAFGKYAVHQRVYRLANFKNINSYFLFYYLSNLFNVEMDKGSAQSTVPSVRLPMLLNFGICIPSPNEQNRIANYLENKCNELATLISDIQSQIEALEEYKRSVITEVVTKGLDPDVEMRDSGVQWIGEIPTHWTLIRIGSLYGLRTQKVSDIDYPPLSVTKMGVLPQLDTVAKTNAHDDRKLVVKGDFVINSRSDRRGSCGISDYTGSVSLINTVLFPITEMNPRYYNWYFHTVGFADEFYRWGHGIVDDLWTTGWQDMKNILISVPPLDEQQRIADYLDSKCAEIDSIITEKKQQIETIEEYKKSLIFEYVTGKKEVIV